MTSNIIANLHVRFRIILCFSIRILWRNGRRQGKVSSGIFQPSFTAHRHATANHKCFQMTRPVDGRWRLNSAMSQEGLVAGAIIGNICYHVPFSLTHRLQCNATSYKRAFYRISTQINYSCFPESVFNTFFFFFFLATYLFMTHCWLIIALDKTPAPSAITQEFDRMSLSVVARQLTFGIRWLLVPHVCWYTPIITVYLRLWIPSICGIKLTWLQRERTR